MKRIMISLFAVALIAGCNCPCKTSTKDVTHYVNPLIGGAATGHTFPGACAPFGMVQASPDTGNANWMYCSGYVSTDEKIRGFSQTHLNGTGCADLGDIQIQPFTGDAARADLFSSYKKNTQKSRVGYYGVTLEDFGVNVEITATPRVAFYRMTYQTAAPARLLVDLQHGLAGGQGQIDNRVLQGESQKEDAYTISGWSQTKGWVTRYYYYVITFDRPITAMQKLEAKKGEKGARYVLDFNLKAGETVQSKIALSSVSIDGAKKNLKAEAADWNFDAVQTKTRASWNTLLSRAIIEGTPAQKENFYTAMYHLFIQPTDIADVDGQYRGADDKVASIPGGAYYSTLSLWDTYRAAHPLYTILSPERVDGFVNTMIAHHKAQGYLPIWTLWGKENHCMVGIHSIPVIVDAYLKGFRGFDAAAAYTCIKESITKKNQGFECEAYDKYGYLPFDTTKGGSVSRLVEHGYDDYCAAQFAKSLGQKDDAAFFAKRAGFYKNVFDPETKFLRGKDTKGNWRTPFDPVKLSHWGSDYVEGNSWQYTWHVMQDPEGLIQLMGGKKAFSDNLSSLFVQPQHVTGEKVLDVTGLIGQYAHGNEPSHHVIYFFNYADDAWKGEELVRTVFDTQYKNTPEGLCGNDDCGQMSAWYIFSAMGFYPFNPCNDGYTFGAPQLPKVTLNLAGGKTFTVEAKGLSEANKYVKSVTLNGTPVKGFKLAHRDIMAGGSLVFEMSPTPIKNR